MVRIKATVYRKRASNILPLAAKVDKSITFDEAVKEFISDMRTENLKKRTIAFHLENLAVMKKILLKHFGKLELETITTQVLKEHFVKYMLDQNLKPNTVNGRIKTARKFLGFLFKERYISANPALELKKVKGLTQNIVAFTEDQISKLLAQANLRTFTGFRNYALMNLMLDNGMRLEDITTISLADLDLKEGQVMVSSKGSAGVIPVSRKCCKIMEEYLAYREQMLPQCDSVFINVNGNNLKRRTIQDIFKAYGKSANIVGVRVSPHTMRHTFAKQYIMNGGDPFSLQKILRHRNMDTVRIYVNLWGSEVKKQHDKFTPLNTLKRQ